MGRADRIWGKLATKLLGKVAPGKAAEWRSGLQGESAPVTRSISLPVLCGLLLRFSYGQHLSSFTCTYRLETQPFLSQSVLCRQVQEFDTPSIRRLCQKASREIIDIVQLDLQEYFKSRDSVCKPPPAMEVIYKEAEIFSFTFNIAVNKVYFKSRPPKSQTSIRRPWRHQRQNKQKHPKEMPSQLVSSLKWSSAKETKLP